MSEISIFSSSQVHVAHLQLLCVDPPGFLPKVGHVGTLDIHRSGISTSYILYDLHTFMNAYTHASIHSFIHTYTHACKRTYIRSCMHTLHTSHIHNIPTYIIHKYMPGSFGPPLSKFRIFFVYAFINLQVYLIAWQVVDPVDLVRVPTAARHPASFVSPRLLNVGAAPEISCSKFQHRFRLCFSEIN